MSTHNQEAGGVAPTEENLKSAEQRGYGRGYAAGKKRAKADRLAENFRREQQAFLDKALLAALPACIEAQGWKTGDEPITNLPQRVALAVRFANETLKQRRIL